MDKVGAWCGTMIFGAKVPSTKDYQSKFAQQPGRRKPDWLDFAKFRAMVCCDTQPRIFWIGWASGAGRTDATRMARCLR